MKNLLVARGFDMEEVLMRLKAFGAPAELFERMTKVTDCG